MTGDAFSGSVEGRFFVWGNRLILAWLAAALLLVLFVAATRHEALLLVCAGVASIPVVFFLFRRPLLNLLLVLCAFVLIADYEDGIQAREVLYGLYFVAYLAYWFVRTVYLERQRILNDVADYLLLFFLVWAGISSSWAIMHGAKLQVILGEGLILMMLALYFPIRHHCRTDSRTYKILLIAAAWLALYTTARNLLIYRAALNDAAFLWQIATGRVALNEVLVMFPALVALSLVLYAKRFWPRMLILGMLTLSTGALVATQSRGYWVAFLVGGIILFALVGRRKKLQFVFLGVGAAAAFAALALILFPDVLVIVVAGIADRFLTLGTAITSDISLLSRYYESLALLDAWKSNPIVGYGIGAPFRFFDVITDSTKYGSYTHNMVAGTLFKFGLVGLVLVLAFWFRTLWRALLMFRSEQFPVYLRLTALAAFVCLGAELVVSNTSSPLLIADATLAIAMLAGAVHGGWELGRRIDEPT